MNKRDSNLIFITVLFLVAIILGLYSVQESKVPLLSPASEFSLDEERLYLYPGGCADLNLDGYVNLGDAPVLSDIIGIKSTDPRFNPLADFNDDGVIDQVDQKCLASYMQKKVICPEGSSYCGCDKGCADLNGDQIVNFGDTALFAQIMGGYIAYDPRADFDNNGVVDEFDQYCLTGFLTQKVNCNYDYLLSDGGCADFNLDGNVDLGDSAYFSSVFGKEVGDDKFNSLADFNDNGVIDNEDSLCLNYYIQKDISCPTDAAYCGCGGGCADLDGNRYVNLADTSIFTQLIEAKSYSPDADFNNDGKVDEFDQTCLNSFVGQQVYCYGEITVEENGGCADLNGDGIVNLGDTASMVQYYDSAYGNEKYDSYVDFDDNGLINEIDLACITKYSTEEIDCPEDTAYCGCDYGCADLNGDQIVNFGDTALFAQIVNGYAPFTTMADFDNDGWVDDFDKFCLTTFMGEKLKCYDQFNDGGCADFNLDGNVDLGDSAYISSIFNTKSGDNGFDTLADFDDNGVINNIDVSCLNKYIGDRDLSCPDDAKYCGCDYGCPDLTGDKIVNAADTVIISQLINGDKYKTLADFDNNGVVDSFDQYCLSLYSAQSFDCYVEETAVDNPDDSTSDDDSSSSSSGSNRRRDDSSSPSGTYIPPTNQGQEYDYGNYDDSFLDKTYNFAKSESGWIIAGLVILALAVGLIIWEVRRKSK